MQPQLAKLMLIYNRSQNHSTKGGLRFNLNWVLKNSGIDSCIMKRFPKHSGKDRIFGKPITDFLCPISKYE